MKNIIPRLSSLIFILMTVFFISIYMHGLGVQLGSPNSIQKVEEIESTDIFDDEEDVKNRELVYTRNTGQIVNTEGKAVQEVLYVASQPGMKLYVRKTGLSYVFSEFTSQQNEREELIDSRVLNEKDQDSLINYHRVDIDFIGAKPAASIMENNESPVIEYYYLSHCSEGLAVNSFKEVIMSELYPGIDLILYTRNGHLKYDWLVKAGADHNQIKMKVSGADNYDLDEKGNLRIETSLGNISESAPIILQDEERIQGGFQIEDGLVSFRVNSYDHSRDLLIDPIRKWSTFYGGNGTEFDRGGCVTDAIGNSYIYGYTLSTDLPTSVGSWQSANQGMNDIYLVKFNAHGDMVWATYYGGSDNEFGQGGCDVDTNGNIVVHGHTSSADFPISSGAWQPGKSGGSDSFIVKFNPQGSRIWSTFVGGGSNEFGNGGCAIDPVGNIFIHGYTVSSDFPVSINAWQNSAAGGRDAYIAKFDSNGMNLWSTYFGGADEDYGAGDCIVDEDGNVSVYGDTNSSDFPVSSGAWQSNLNGGYDTYLAQFNPSGTREWATYFGGTSDELGFGGTAIGIGGAIYFQGYTHSTDFPVSAGAYQTSNAGSIDAFLVKFSADGSREWATYFGGSSNDYGDKGCAVDNEGKVYMLGYTLSSDLPITVDAWQSSNSGLRDMFFTKFNNTGNLEWSSYYGGSQNDYAEGGCSVDSYGNVYFHGGSQSSDFPVSTSAWQSNKAEAYDAVLVKFGPVLNCSMPTLSTQIIENCNSGTYDIHLDIGADGDSNNGYDVFYSVEGGVISIPENFEGGTVNNHIGNFETGENVDVVVVHSDDNQCHQILYNLNSSCSPVAICQNLIVNADMDCQAIIPAEQFNDGSFDPEDDELSFLVNPAGPFPLGTTLVTLYVEDSNGLIDSCLSEINVVDTQVPTFSNVPSAFTQSNDPGVCGANVFWVNPTVSDNCNSTSVSANNESGDFFEIGSHQVQFTAVDAAGNIAITEFDFTIVDSEEPEISCSVSGFRFVDQPNATYEVQSTEFDPFGVSDNCSDPSSIIISHNADSITGAFAGPDDSSLTGWQLPEGAHDITFTIEDAAGNTNNCSVTITVEPIELNGNMVINQNCIPVDVRVRVYEQGTTSLVGTFVAPVTGSGYFTLPLSGVGTGSHDIFVKTEGYLQQGVLNQNISGSSINVSMSDMSPGDIAGGSEIFNDNIVNSLDLSLMLLSYNTQFNDPNFNPKCDLNCQNQVDGLDLAILSFFFSSVGDYPNP